MPTYEYACTSCKHQFEIVQSFSDDALTTCEECGGELRKVFSGVGIVFKGSGFYKNDSKGSSSTSSSSSSSSSPDSAATPKSSSADSSSSSSTTSAD